MPPKIGSKPSRNKSKAWTSNAFVEATIAGLKEGHARAGHNVTGADAVRLFLGKLKRPGIFESRRLSTEERAAFKAELFDMVFEVYGASLTPGLRHVENQSGRRDKAASVKKAAGDKTRREVYSMVADLLAGGMPDHNVASAVAKKLGITDTHVRNIRRKEAKSPLG